MLNSSEYQWMPEGYVQALPPTHSVELPLSVFGCTITQKQHPDLEHASSLLNDAMLTLSLNEDKSISWNLRLPDQKSLLYFDMSVLDKFNSEGPKFAYSVPGVPSINYFFDREVMDHQRISSCFFPIFNKLFEIFEHVLQQGHVLRLHYPLEYGRDAHWIWHNRVSGKSTILARATLSSSSENTILLSAKESKHGDNQAINEESQSDYYLARATSFRRSKTMGLDELRRKATVVHQRVLSQTTQQFTETSLSYDNIHEEQDRHQQEAQQSQQSAHNNKKPLRYLSEEDFRAKVGGYVVRYSIKREYLPQYGIENEATNAERSFCTSYSTYSESKKIVSGFFLKSLYSLSFFQGQNFLWPIPLPSYSFDFIAEDGLYTLLPFAPWIEDGMNPYDISVKTENILGLFPVRYLLGSNQTEEMLLRIASYAKTPRRLPSLPKFLEENIHNPNSREYILRESFNQVYLLLLNVGGPQRIKLGSKLYDDYYNPSNTNDAFLDNFITWIANDLEPCIYDALIQRCRIWLSNVTLERDQIRVLLDPFLRHGGDLGSIDNVLRALNSCLTLCQDANLLEMFYLIGIKEAQSVVTLSEALFEFGNESQLGLDSPVIQRDFCLSLEVPTSEPLNKSHIKLYPRAALLLLLDLASCVVNGQKNRSDPVVQFTEHFLWYAALNRVKLTVVNIDELFERYHKLTQILRTNHSAREADYLERLFLRQLLIKKDGLSIAPVKLDLTIFKSLEVLFQNALKHHRLEDQLFCLPGLSLAWRDTPYALHDGCIVASSEMRFERARLNFNGHYSKPTSSDLKGMCQEKIQDGALFKERLFRYLGSSQLCRPIGEYQQIALLLPQAEHVDANLGLRLLAIYVLLTAEGIQEPKYVLNKKMFETINTLYSHSDAAQLSRIWSEALPQLNHLLSTEENRVSLWQLYKKYSSESQLAQSQSIVNSILSLFLPDAVPPNVLTSFFKPHLLSEFLQNRWVDIEKSEEFLSEHAPGFPRTMLKSIIYLYTKDKLTRSELIHWIDIDYFDLSLKKLRQQINGFERTILAYVDCISKTYDSDIRIAVRKLLPAIGIAKTVLAWQIFEEWLKRLNVVAEKPLRIVFFKALAQHADLLKNAEEKQSREVLHLWIAFYLRHRPDNLLLSGLLKACTIAMSTSLPLQCMTTILNTTYEAEQLWKQQYPLTTQQMENITGLICHTKRVVPFIIDRLSEDKTRTFAVLMPYISLPKRSFDAALSLMEYMIKACIRVDGEMIKHLCQHNERVLTQAARWYGNLTEIKRRENLDFLQEFFNANSDEYLLDKLDLQYRLMSIDKTDLSRVESWDEYLIKNEISTQMIFTSKDSIGIDTLLESLFRVKAHGLEQTPLFPKLPTITTESVQNAAPYVFYTLPQRINDLAPNEGYRLYQQCCHILRLPLTIEQRMAVLEPLIALCNQVMYEETDPHQFPRAIQSASVLNAYWHISSSTLHELPTGSGKSMIIALMVALDYALGWSPDVVTQNKQLIQDALRLYGAFYRRLGIDFADEVITVDDPKALYRKGQVHFMTVEDRVFFEIKQRLNASPIALNNRLLIDEAHLILTTTVECNLAMSNGASNHLGAIDWSWVLGAVWKFVHDESLFLKNLCSEADDRRNVQKYVEINLLARGCLITNIKTLLSTINDENWDDLIDSAHTASILVENEDLVLLEKEEGLTYAAPVLEQTNRPCLSVSYGKYTQAILHWYFKQIYPESSWVEVDRQDVVLAAHPSVLFKWATLGAVAFTGTAGDLRAVHFFEQAHGLKTIRYQTQPIITVNRHKAVSATGVEAHGNLMVEFILNWHQDHPNNAILVFLKDPKAVYALRDRLNQANCLNVDLYEGYDRVGSNERDMIKRAGHDGQITLTTPAWSCGVDIKPKSLLTVIIGCTKIDELTLRQMEGRTGRNSHEGHVFYVLDEADILQGDESVEDRWRKQCQQILKDRQTQLEANHHFNTLYNVIVFEKYLEHVKKMQQIGLAWHGNSYSLVSQKKDYMLLIDGIDPALMSWFSKLHSVVIAKKFNYMQDKATTLSALANDCSLHWENTFSSFINNEDIYNYVRPINWSRLSLLHNVPNLKLADLLAVSQFSQTLEKMLGNKDTQNIEKSLLPHVTNFAESILSIYSSMFQGLLPSLQQIRVAFISLLSFSEKTYSQNFAHSVTNLVGGLKKVINNSSQADLKKILEKMIEAVEQQQWTETCDIIELFIQYLAIMPNLGAGMMQVKVMWEQILASDDPTSLPLKQILDISEMLCKESIITELYTLLSHSIVQDDMILGAFSINQLKSSLSKVAQDLSEAQAQPMEAMNTAGGGRSDRCFIVNPLIGQQVNQHMEHNKVSEVNDLDGESLQKFVLSIVCALREYEHLTLSQCFNVDYIFQMTMSAVLNSKIQNYLTSINDSNSSSNDWRQRMISYLSSKITPGFIWKVMRPFLPKGPKAMTLALVKLFDSTVGWVPLILSFIDPSAHTHVLKVMVQFLVKSIYDILNSDISIANQPFKVFLESIDMFWEEAKIETYLREQLPEAMQHEALIAMYRKVLNHLKSTYGDKKIIQCLQPGYLFQMLIYILKITQAIPFFPASIKQALALFVDIKRIEALSHWNDIAWPSFIALFYAMSHPLFTTFLKELPPDTPMALVNIIIDSLATNNHVVVLSEELQQSVASVTIKLPAQHTDTKASFWSKKTGFTVEDINHGIEQYTKGTCYSLT